MSKQDNKKRLSLYPLAPNRAIKAFMSIDPQKIKKQNTSHQDSKKKTK